MARENLRRATETEGEFSVAASGAKAALADILGERGAWDEADRLINEAYNTERQRLGPAHPRCCNYFRTQRRSPSCAVISSLAETRYRAVAKDAEQVLGKNHPETLRAFAHVAVALANSGKNVEAIALFEPLIGQRTAVLGADHPDILMMRMNYGVSLRAVGRSADAERELEDVYQRRRNVLGEIHPETLRVLGILGNGD